MQVIVRRFMQLSEEGATYSTVSVVEEPVTVVYSCQGLEHTSTMLKAGKHHLWLNGDHYCVGPSPAFQRHGTLNPTSTAILLGNERLMRSGIPAIFGTGEEVEHLCSLLEKETEVSLIVVDLKVNPSMN